MNNLKEQIETFRQMQSSIRQTYERRLSQLRQERDEMADEYNGEIAELEGELHALGLSPAGSYSGPTEIGVKAYNYLREHGGTQFTSQQIMSAIRANGAVASVVLSPFVVDGRVKTEGERRGRVYYVPTLPQAAAA